MSSPSTMNVLVIPDPLIWNSSSHSLSSLISTFFCDLRGFISLLYGLSSPCKACATCQGIEPGSAVAPGKSHGFRSMSTDNWNNIPILGAGASAIIHDAVLGKTAHGKYIINFLYPGNFTYFKNIILSYK